MAQVNLTLEDELVAGIDLLVLQRKEFNTSKAAQCSAVEVAEARKMAVKDGNAKRGNAYLAQCSAKRQYANTSRHAICEEFLRLGYEATVAMKEYQSKNPDDK